MAAVSAPRPGAEPLTLIVEVDLEIYRYGELAHHVVAQVPVLVEGGGREVFFRYRALIHIGTVPPNPRPYAPILILPVTLPAWAVAAAPYGPTDMRAPGAASSGSSGPYARPGQGGGGGGPLGRGRGRGF
jgi:hypothetical protein